VITVPEVQIFGTSYAAGYLRVQLPLFQGGFLRFQGWGFRNSQGRNASLVDGQYLKGESQQKTSWPTSHGDAQDTSSGFPQRRI
jgi:hypothetical protein